MKESEFTATITSAGVERWSDGYVDMTLPDVVREAKDALERLAHAHPGERFTLTIYEDALEASLEDGDSPAVYVFWRKEGVAS